jgi:hypothetical protein
VAFLAVVVGLAVHAGEAAEPAATVRIESEGHSAVELSARKIVWGCSAHFVQRVGC